MATNYKNGIGGDLVLNLNNTPTTMHVKTWTLKLSNKNPETPNTGSSYMQRIAGLTDWSVECEAYWDANLVPTGAALNIIDGVTGTVTCNVGNTGSTFSGPVIVKECTVKNDVESYIGFNFTLDGNGTLSAPL